MATPRVHLFMSALVYPGVGQFMQRRILWGVVYSFSFTVMFAVLCVVTVRQIWDVAGNGRLLADALRALVRPLAILLGIWVANIYDTWWADYSKSKRSASPPLP